MILIKLWGSGKSNLIFRYIFVWIILLLFVWKLHNIVRLEEKRDIYCLIWSQDRTIFVKVPVRVSILCKINWGTLQRHTKLSVLGNFIDPQNCWMSKWHTRGPALAWSPLVRILKPNILYPPPLICSPPGFENLTAALQCRNQKCLSNEWCRLKWCYLKKQMTL